ncbi:MAG: AIM24 family protein [Acidimicrobiaceae bacterium]|nr:AIM24 family protein [Acidimicrobiaceae bacterium]
MAHRVLGTTMPVLEVQLQPGQSVISQGGEMSWMTSSVQMATATSGAGGSGVLGVLKRAVAGGTIFMSQYTAQASAGTVAFAAKMPGHIMAIHVDAQHEYMVSRHGFLAATPEVTLNIGLQQKLGVGIFSGNGFILQRIAGKGTAWIELSGEVITYDLAAGEQMMVHPGHVGLFESSVTIDITMVKGIKNMLFGADTIFLAKLTGPGKIHLQTLTLPGMAHAMIPYLPVGEGNSGGIGGLPFKLG